ncbi:cytochrome c [Desulfobacterales bacterium HSG2]|nr:cytochrome c [Desulfobacterales bacterium HSG2]
MRKIVGLLVCFMVMGVLLYRPASSVDGETLFKMKCGKCHTKGGGAPIFAPVKYASSQWKRFFQREKHKRKKDISSDVSEKEIALIKEYLIDHAADSDRPIAAGLR